MKRYITLTAASICLILATQAGADDSDRPTHYQAMEADSIEQTLENLREANEKLDGLLDEDMSDRDIHEVHSVSYTLEESLARIIGELEMLADTVEDMHFQSEGLKREAVLDYGHAYLDGIKPIVP